MNKIENDFNEICSPNLIFQYKNCFQEDSVNFWTKEFTLKTENVKFLTSPPQFVYKILKNLLRGLIGIF